jgi:trehalose 6-phosphate synthase/phosphatase
MTEVAKRTSGSVVEEKTAGLAWHFRAAEPQLAAARLVEMRTRLNAIIRESDVLELHEGSKVIEVRPRGINKGLVVGPSLESAPPNSAVLAMGDDRTDEDLFAALPDHAIAIHVGNGRTIAGYRIGDHVAARRFLASLCGDPS